MSPKAQYQKNIKTTLVLLGCSFYWLKPLNIWFEHNPFMAISYIVSVTSASRVNGYQHSKIHHRKFYTT